MIGGNTFVFLPAGGNYKIMNSNVLGSGGGAYNVFIDQINGNDDKTGSVYFDEIPIKNSETNSQIDIDLTEGLNEEIVPIVKVDEDNDGIFEKEVSPTTILDASNAADITPPVSANSIYQNTVSLSSMDENSGVLKTEYSLDGGITWVIYKDPIEVRPTIDSGVTIKYFSTDKAGNIEVIQTIYIPKLEEQISTSLPIVTSNNSIHRSLGRWVVMGDTAPKVDANAVLPTIRVLDVAIPEKIIDKSNKVKNPIKVSKQKSIENQISKKNFDLGTGQVATVVNSNILIKSPYWVLLISSGLSVIFIAKRYRKYKIKK
jgi:hypothetical protein